MADIWKPIEWKGYSNIYGMRIWTDGNNVYYSESTNQYILDKETSTWVEKNWNNSDCSDFFGSDIFYVGQDVYLCNSGKFYIFNKDTLTWTFLSVNKNGLDDFYMWTDGENTYYSYYTVHYVLNKEEFEWEDKTWNGLSKFTGQEIWFDGNNVYHNKGYILNKATSTWEQISINTPDPGFSRNCIWSDDKGIYYSTDYSRCTTNCVWNKQNRKWEERPMNGLAVLQGTDIWKDGDNIYYSYGNKVQYVLSKKDLSNKINGTLYKQEDGYYIALHFDSDNWEKYDSVKAGIISSEKEELVDILEIPDKNKIFKIQFPNIQTFKIIATKDDKTVEKEYDLSELIGRKSKPNGDIDLSWV